MSEPLSPNQRAWRRFRRNTPAVVSGWFLLVLLAAIIGISVLQWSNEESAGDSGLKRTIHRFAQPLPLSLRVDPDFITESQFAHPGSEHWLGTDIHGRDLFARIFAGSRISLLVGLVGAGVALIIGVLWGAIAGYVGGRWDDVMMRFVDVLYSLPSIVFVIVLITTLDEITKRWLGKHISASAATITPVLFLFAGLGAVSWLNMARIVRGQVLSLRSRQFIDASRALGASHARLLFRHILPNTLGIVIVYTTLTIPSIILYESFLSYLGLGVQPPMASWGTLIADGAQQLNSIRTYWWLIVFPAAALVSTLLALNFFGDGLRDAWDPRADR